MENIDRSILSLFQVGNSIHNLNRKSEKEFGISLVQWCLLKKLVDMPATSAHALSKATGVHPSTLTQTLRRLERKKLVFMTEDPKDSRRKVISITRVGKTTMDSVGQRMKVRLKILAEASLALETLNQLLREKPGKILAKGKN